MGPAVRGANSIEEKPDGNEETYEKAQEGQEAPNHENAEVDPSFVVTGEFLRW